MNRYRAGVLGASAGGQAALRRILGALGADFPAPLLVVQHRGPQGGEFLIRDLDEATALSVQEAEEKEPVRPGVVYVAPANYHLLVETDGHLSLSVGERVQFARPSIDVLFEAAADAWGPRLVGAVLTGANRDGSAGLRRVADRGGFALVQDPAEAESAAMPRAALAAVPEARVLPLMAIGPFLSLLFQETE